MTTPHPSPNPASVAQHAPTCIGVFDSGVGGLSVLRSLRQQLPNAPLLYVGDVSHAPYGERPAAEVMARCERIVEHLIAQQARVIVVACNTATAIGIEGLRQRWPQVRFVGVEPGVKPAAAASRTGRIAVMTTPITAASARLRELIERYAPRLHVHVQPCPGLAGAIERGQLEGPTLTSILRPFCEQMRAANVDTVALGCTHYPFVAAGIASLLGSEVTLIDTSAAVAQRVASVAGGIGETEGPATVRVSSTGDRLTMQCLLDQSTGLAGTMVEHLAV